MLYPGNGKLGAGIWTWSIPPVSTCPGRSVECEKLCYARGGFFAMPSVMGAYAKNLELAKRSDFPALVRAELLAKGIQTLRIHVAGDFYDADYTRKWLKIIRQNRQTRFFAFTRSWRDPKVLPILLELAREKNLQLWFSWDRAMPYPPRVKNVRIAYMSVRDDDVPSKHVDLVFRTKRLSTMKFMGPAVVCPHEQGVERKIPVTCTSCRLCFETKRLQAAKRAAKSHDLALTGD